MTWHVEHDDCVRWLQTLPPDSIDSCVTDAPYGLGKDYNGAKLAAILSAWMAGEEPEIKGSGFMGRAWDAIVPSPMMWAELYRVLKPGAYAIVFAGERTVDLMGVSLALAGFERVHLIGWVTWHSFPKSMDISKAIDRQRYDIDQIRQVTRWIAEQRDAAGVTNREIDAAFGFHGMAGHWTSQASQPAIPTLDQVPALLDALGGPEVPPEIRRLLWDLNGRKGQPGEAWGEREVVGHKDSGLDSGSGVTVDFSASTGRDETGLVPITAPATDAARQWEGWGTALKKCIEPAILVRKPREGTYANNVLTHGVGGLNIDATRHWYGDPMWLGPTGDVASVLDGGAKGHGGVFGDSDTYDFHGSPAGRWPSNLLYCPVPSTAEREAGLSDLPAYTGADITGREAGSEGLKHARAGSGGIPGARRNVHPTPKPIALLRRLCRLITPPDGTVIDPFTGSGSTGCAAVVEGFDFLGCELNNRPEATPPEPYVAIARARIAWWEAHGDRSVEIHTGSTKAAEAREDARDAGQLSIFGGVA